MAGTIKISEYEVNEALADTDLMEVFQPSSGGIRREKKGLLSVLKTFFQADIKDGTAQLNPRSFTSGRFDSQELVSGSLSVSGWYTIAESLEDSAQILGCDLLISMAGSGSRRGIITGHVSISSEAAARTFENTSVRMKDLTSATDVRYLKGLRLAKSDSVAASGQKIQVNCDISTSVILATQIKNLAEGAGFFLVAPYLDNTPTLPDGVTAGTFLEAGAEQTFEPSATHYFSNWIGSKSGNDQLRCSVEWHEIPKQGTNIVLTLPATLLAARDGEGISVTISVAHTISNFAIDGKHINFFINETGVFTTLNTGPIGILVSGAGCKLTIT